MADQAGSPWWVVLAAAVPSAASGLWVFWRWWVERGDKRHETTLSREERLMRDLDLQRQGAAKDAAEIFARTKAELDRLYARVLEIERERDRLEADRDRGWNLARRWCDIAYDLAGKVRSAQSVADGLWRDAPRGSRLEPPKWKPFLLPEFEAALPKPQEEKP